MIGNFVTRVTVPNSAFDTRFGVCDIANNKSGTKEAGRADMSTVAAKFATVGTRFQVGAAACAIAGAAVLTPAVAAQADIVALPVPAAPAFSDVLASPVITDFMAAPALGAGTAAEQGWWWFWGPGPGEDGPTTFFEFTPLALIPNWIKPLYSWFTQNIDFSTCVFGITLSIGPYGTTKLGYSTGC